jgi:hypothetical protein
LTGRRSLMGEVHVMSRFSSRSKAVAAGFLIVSLSAVGQTGSGQAKTPVLVELFTSEGCSSCPPADALLMKLEQEQPVAGAEIIVLGEHVDYWDRLGWRDRFSSHLNTERQNGYGRRFHLESVYTPQMVVDGQEEFVGNDAGHAQRAIVQAGQTAKIGLRLSDVVVEPKRVSGVVAVALGTAGLAGSTMPKGDLYAALVDPVAVTNVRSGENGGRQLKHVGVVRSLERIGSLQDLGSGAVKFSLVVPGEAVAEKERVVVFAQRAGQGAVLGAVDGPGNVASR